MPARRKPSILPACPDATLDVSGFGQYCINCHASAAAGQSTYSTMRFFGVAPRTNGPFDLERAIHLRLARQVGPKVVHQTGTLSPTRADLPSMLYPSATAKCGTPEKCIVNLSVYGEWRYSMMGLAGRDPIFFSQLNSESTLHANLEDHPTDSVQFVQDLCLRCHGVMGQRQYKQDTGKLFMARTIRTFRLCR